LPLIGEDPPVHTQHRRLVQPALSQRAAAALTPWIEEEVHRLLDTWPGDDADAVEHLTARLTAAVAGRVLGIPREDQPRFHRWAEDYFDDTTGQGIRATTEQQMLRLLDQLLGQDRAEDGGGLFATLASSGAEAGLDRPLVLALALVVAVAAHETTSYLIASMLNALAHHPAAWELLRTGPEHIERVVEETLRRESPAQVLHRRVVRDVEMDGVVLRAGERVAVSFGAANRDPGVFTRPAEFLPQREEGPHLAFGIGVHACPGAPLARAQAAAVLRVLLERGWRPAPGSRPGTRQVRTSRLLGFSSLPLRFER
jgi:cytochrome P450